ncbi:uncharacterized protein LOC119172147 isoform X3 [Rhipicephalus microplus]|uniref:uncharacterized protein LOC119172147 isoform X3 n=1 Tax=Rhipicephalus microplus TaxID=6941 RepID=UPI0018897DA1|nr:uncharacterized protein LOC119172147 isoform X1 [Rhipicephalus microplus]
MMDGLPLPGGCVDRRGTPVEHGDRYTPEGKDPCEQCTCQRGRPDSCSITSCYPPAHCHQPYLRGSGECCDYACNGTTLGSPDGADVQSATTLGLRMVASTVASFLIVALLLFMIHRLRKRRLLVMIRRLNGCRAAASLEEACLARQLALEEQGVGFLGGFCPDPPPPYTFWKPPEAYVPPGEAPPPYDAPPVLIERQQEVAPNSMDPLPRVASATPPLLCGGSSTSSEAGEPPQQQRAIRSDAYYEDGLRHVTVVLVGDQAARRRLSHCEPSVRRLVQDGDKRLSLQGPPPNQNNNVYPDPTSWGGEGEEGGSETSSSCTASVDDRQGAFSPTSSESSVSADVPEVGQVSQPTTAVAAEPPKTRHSLNRTLQRLKRFSMPKRKASKKACTAGASSSAEGIATSCCLGHGSGVASDKNRTGQPTGSSAQGNQQLPESDGGLERLSVSPPEARHSSSSHQDTVEDKASRKKTGKRKLFALPSWDSSVLRKVPEGCSEARDPLEARVASEVGTPAVGNGGAAARPSSLDLPTATSTPKNLASACPVVITVKCRPVRTESTNSSTTDRRAESPHSSSSSASACSKMNKQRTPEVTGASPKPNGPVTVQPYVEAVHTISRQSVARQVARLEAQGFRPPDASCTLQKHCRSASHDSRCQERLHCKVREGQMASQPAAPF